MLSYILVNLIILFISISITFILFKATGDTIDRYDIPYFIISELISILNELNIINETTKYLK